MYRRAVGRPDDARRLRLDPARGLLATVDMHRRETLSDFSKAAYADEADGGL